MATEIVVYCPPADHRWVLARTERDLDADTELTEEERGAVQASLFGVVLPGGAQFPPTTPRCPECGASMGGQPITREPA